MDYTLVHYHVREWEAARLRARPRAACRRAAGRSAGLAFDPELVHPRPGDRHRARQLVKANRFGFVKQACHGTRDARPRRAARALRAHDRRPGRAALGVPQHAVLALRGVHLRAAGRPARRAAPARRRRATASSTSAVRESVDATHIEGELKAEIVARPRALRRRRRGDAARAARLRSTPARSCCSSPTRSGATRAR